MKKCRKCEMEKSLEDFPRKRQNLDGRNHVCKECIKEKNSLYRQKKKNDFSFI